MSLIKKMRRQTAVWWKRLTPDRYGKFAYSTPVEIDCRWEDVAQEFVNDKGEMQVSRALVYVDRVMAPGDRLLLGAVESDTPDDPLLASRSFEIRRFDQLPTLKATETLLTAYL